MSLPVFVGSAPKLAAVVESHASMNAADTREARDRLHAALAAQTLPREHWELIVSPAARERGPRALAGARAPIAVFLDASLEPTPELLELHLRGHRDAPGPALILGSIHASPRQQSPLAALLDGREPLFARKKLVRCAANASAPVASWRACGGVDPADGRDPLIAESRLIARLAEAGLAILECEDARALAFEEPQAAALVARHRVLGRELARLAGQPRAADLAALCGLSADDSWRALERAQLCAESWLPREATVVEQLEALLALPPVEARGPVALLGIVPLLEGVCDGAFALGLIEELEGRDPRLALCGSRAAAELVSIVPCGPDVDLEACEQALDAEQPQEVVRRVEDARGTWIVLLEGGARPAPGWLARLVWHARVDSMAGCVRAAARPLSAGSRGLPGDERTFDRLAREFEKKHGRRARYGVRPAPGALLMRRAMLAELGGLDRRFAAPMAQLADLELALAARGLRCREALDVLLIGSNRSRCAPWVRLSASAASELSSKWAPDAGVTLDLAALERRLRLGHAESSSSEAGTARAA